MANKIAFVYQEEGENGYLVGNWQALPQIVMVNWQILSIFFLDKIKRWHLYGSLLIFKTLYWSMKSKIQTQQSQSFCYRSLDWDTWLFDKNEQMWQTHAGWTADGRRVQETHPPSTWPYLLLLRSNHALTVAFGDTSAVPKRGPLASWGSPDFCPTCCLLAHFAPYSSHPEWAVLSGIQLTSCPQALPWAGTAASCSFCQFSMAMWENSCHISRLNSNATPSTKVSELPPAWHNPSSLNIQRTSLVPLWKQVLYLIHIMVI